MIYATKELARSFQANQFNAISFWHHSLLRNYLKEP
jgi:hypothetical protein